MYEIVWITGGSSGIGLELVKRWLQADNKVIVSSPNATKTPDLLALREKYPHALAMVDMDVSNSDSIRQGIKKVWNTFGHVDLWMYNVGVYELTKLNEWNVADFEQMTNINYLGAVRVATEIYPYFEAKGSGRWVFNASLSSYFGLPYGGGYSATKAALANFAESIYPELLTKNIHLKLINHGFVKTALTAKNDFEMPWLMAPKDAADAIFNALDNDGFEITFPWKLRAVLWLLRFLPYRVSLYLTQKMLR